MERAIGASKSKEVVVWDVAFLSDHTIISGDSAGKVQIWDGFTGTLIRTHLVTKWDVLALSVSQVDISPRVSTHVCDCTRCSAHSWTVGKALKMISQDESSVIAGTSEGTVVQFQFMPSTVDQQDKEWVRTRTFKNHSHDVRALVHTETAVVSGGQCFIFFFKGL